MKNQKMGTVKGTDVYGRDPMADIIDNLDVEFKSHGYLLALLKENQDVIVTVERERRRYRLKYRYEIDPVDRNNLSNHYEIDRNNLSRGQLRLIIDEKGSIDNYIYDVYGFLNDDDGFEFHSKLFEVSDHFIWHAERAFDERLDQLKGELAAMGLM